MREWMAEADAGAAMGWTISVRASEALPQPLISTFIEFRTVDQTGRSAAEW